ncbi:MAG: hypothetical protein JST80_00380 [Bdellovibrionales bacterium]|nr:hypothetical protein [Bdellovibrionales bacterium]
MTPRLMWKLASLPLKRSWFLLGLMMVSFAQLMLVLWFAAAVYVEIQKTEHYSRTAKFITLQVKDPSLTLDQVRDKLPVTNDKSPVSVEELQTEDVLKRMETEEPEVVQTVRSLGPEGLQLVPKVILIRGEVPDTSIERLKMMTEVSRVEVSPIHHARLRSFYHHLSFEMKIGFLLFLFLVLVQLLVFQRVQQRDLAEVVRNMLAWGAGYGKARLPGAMSLFLLSLISIVISAIEWMIFNERVWRGNAFLGELSIDRSLSFPFSSAGFMILLILAMSLVISFAGRGDEE